VSFEKCDKCKNPSYCEARKGCEVEWFWQSVADNNLIGGRSCYSCGTETFDEAARGCRRCGEVTLRYL